MSSADTVHNFVAEFYGDQADKTEKGEPTLLEVICKGFNKSYTGTKSSTRDYFEALPKIHPVLQNSSFGSGVPCPPALTGCKVLDQGCGMGRDVFIFSQLVGPSGSVTGIDMTPKMIEVGKKYTPWHSEKFGYANVDFKQVFLENLWDYGFTPESYDVITSNGVLCLCTDKRTVLNDAFKLLKPGGEMYFSDIFVDKQVPQDILNNTLAYNAGLGGLVWSEFQKMAQDVGFMGPFLLDDHVYDIHEDIKPQFKNFTFWSRMVRLFKPDDNVVPSGQPETLTFVGGDGLNEEEFKLDAETTFQNNVPMKVSGEIASAVKRSRYAKYFKF